MLEKQTTEMLSELLQTNNIDSYMTKNKEHMLDDTLARLIEAILEHKDLQKPDVIRDSEINEIYAYQIFAGTRRPSRDKLICLCFGMKLSLDETQQLFKFAGYAPLYAKNPRDSIIIYSIEHASSVVQTNHELYRYNQKTL